MAAKKTSSPKTQESSQNLGSVHTSNLPAILKQLNISLVVSTYQAGKLVLMRPEADAINTHFISLNKPMGVYADYERIFVGARQEILEYKNMPAVSAKMNPPNVHDACYLVKNRHYTGDIDIHEMEYAKDKLWFINTRFSALCSYDQDSSFVPEWMPDFISKLAPEDRCHLNGLCMIEGKPKYVTALGKTDTKGGWRENKRNGGILIDVDTKEIVMQGLSMPHSPRWYRDKLWILNSGEGFLTTLDLKTKKLTNIVELPGFARGISFVGPLAFIGLSKVRESAVFSDFPLIEKLEERQSGVWVVNIETSQIIGFLKFTEGVEEIFSVVAIAKSTFPAILDTTDELMDSSYSLPDKYMHLV